MIYDEDEGDGTETCDHIDYDLDTITGRARCDDCGKRWDATEIEIRHYIARHT